MKKYSNYLTIAIALVWLINGLYAKLLLQVPRHQQIVGHLLGEANAYTFTKLIGLAEVAMCIWILSKKYFPLNGIIQISIVFIMNIIEYFFASSLLLWGKWNLIFALLFCIVVYFHQVYHKKNSA